jgi:quercetin dioxygenase-like cupin family protein
MPFNLFLDGVAFSVISSVPNSRIIQNGLPRGPIDLTSEEIVMNAHEAKRRTFLFGIGALSVNRVLPSEMTHAVGAASQGYVLAATEGEHLVHFRDHGNIFIKVGSATGSDNLALGTQQVTIGAGIPIHRHLRMDEAFYVLEGGGIFVLNDTRLSFEKGGTIFIPKNSWHGFENPDHELLLLWTMSPAGLDGFFRDTCSPAGLPPKQLNREQIHEIALKYGTEFK